MGRLKERPQDSSGHWNRVCYEGVEGPDLGAMVRCWTGNRPTSGFSVTRVVEELSKFSSPKACLETAEIRCSSRISDCEYIDGDEPRLPRSPELMLLGIVS